MHASSATLNTLTMRLRLHAVPVLFSRSQSGIQNEKPLANSISVAKRITRILAKYAFGQTKTTTKVRGVTRGGLRDNLFRDILFLRKRVHKIFHNSQLRCT